MKEGEKNDSLSVVNSVVTKDGTVTFTNKGGLINLKTIAINDAGKTVRHWDFTNITDKDLKSLQSDAAIWSAASDKSGVYTNRTSVVSFWLSPPQSQDLTSYWPVRSSNHSERRARMCFSDFFLSREFSPCSSAIRPQQP